MIIKVTTSIQSAIRDMRKQKGIRGDILSQDVGKSPSFISRIESGRTKTIDDSILFAIFKILMKKDDSEVQEYIDLFIDVVPEASDFNSMIDSLSENKLRLLNKFLSCLDDEANSNQFINYVLQAIDLSNEPIDKLDDDSLDVFPVTLASTMQVWKRRKAQER